MANCKIELSAKYYTAPQVQKMLGLSRFQLTLRIDKGIFPSPTVIDSDTGVRYFDEHWVRIARAVLNNAVGVA